MTNTYSALCDCNDCRSIRGEELKAEPAAPAPAPAAELVEVLVPIKDLEYMLACGVDRFGNLRAALARASK